MYVNQQTNTFRLLSVTNVKMESAALLAYVHSWRRERLFMCMQVKGISVPGILDYFMALHNLGAIVVLVGVSFPNCKESFTYVFAVLAVFRSSLKLLQKQY